MTYRPFLLTVIILFACTRGYSQHLDINVTTSEYKIYNNGTLMGTYKNVLIDSELLSIVVYNLSNNRVAEAIHAPGDANWSIATPVDQNKLSLPFNKANFLAPLFKFLIEKKYL